MRDWREEETERREGLMSRGKGERRREDKVKEKRAEKEERGGRTQ